MPSWNALLVGAGGMGQTWAKNLHDHPDVQIGGWVDLRRDAVTQAATELNLPALHVDTDLTQAIAVVKPDFVVDVTIPEAHHGVTLTALAAGVPVLGEKPMAASMQHAQAMVAAATAAGTLARTLSLRAIDAWYGSSPTRSNARSTTASNGSTSSSRPASTARTAWNGASAPSR